MEIEADRTGADRVVLMRSPASPPSFGGIDSFMTAPLGWAQFFIPNYYCDEA